MRSCITEIRRCEQVLREADRAILAARFKLVLLWLPATLGLSWATDRVINQQDAISEWKYNRNDFRYS